MTNELYKGIETFYPESRAEWRAWLILNHITKDSVWVIFYHKKTRMPSMQLVDAIKEALCFGWIDSKPNKRDEESYYLFFSKRNIKSNWSAVNKKFIEELEKENLMVEAGRNMIDIAKKTGTWDALNDIDNLVVPEDLQKLFDMNETAFNYWNQFPRSAKRGILEWIFNAKTEATRKKRIDETVSLSEKNIRANQFYKK